MKTLLRLFFTVTASVAMFYSCKKGCTDPNAANYNPSANKDNGSCYYINLPTNLVVTLTNTPKGGKLIQDVYGDRFLIIPYEMPGFKLASMVYKIAKKVNWQLYEGMILLNHGIISFGTEAYESDE